MSTENANQTVQRHALLTRVGLATPDGAERLNFGLGVVGTLERISLRDAVRDGVFDCQLRCCCLSSVLVGAGEFPLGGCRLFCESGLFLHSRLLCVRAENLLDLVL